jgi:NSS family neurotransmitter:Na+ symporter
MTSDRGTFGRLGFVFAAVGSAIGLGNIWKFPYISYANEGGSFVLIYLVAIALIGAPVMVAEILLGRHSQSSAVAAFRRISDEIKASRWWTVAGALGVCAGAVLLSYYAVIAGWTVYYFGRCVSWSLRGFDLEAAEVGASFGEFLANGPVQIGFQAFFLTVTVSVVVLGVRAGIERVTSTLMPILALILVALAISSVRNPGFGEAIRFLFHVGPIDADGVLEAVGHSFFTLSLGMGGMITYGSYLSKNHSIPRSTLLVCIFDTLVALLASVIMFSIIFSVPEAERAATFSKSATILFTTLPSMFYSLPFGNVLSPVFYLLVAFAALTSTIAILEVVVAFLIDSFGLTRRRAALTAGVGIFLLGLPAALSLGASPSLSSFTIPFFPDGTAGFFGIYDYAVSNWFLPVGGLLIAIFTGWLIPDRIARPELELGHGRFRLYGAWRFLLRWLAPIAILWVIVAVIGGRTF